MGFLGKLVSFAIDTVQMVRGGKASFSSIAMKVLTTAPGAIMEAIQFGKLPNSEKLDEALAEFDARTGSDIGALDIIRDLPPDKEEIFFDALKTAIEVLGKNQLKVDGYYVEEST